MSLPSPLVSSWSPLLLMGFLSIEGSCFALCRAFFSAVNSFDSSPQLGKICLLFHVLKKYIIFFRLCSQMHFWMSLFSLGSSDEVGPLLHRSSRLVITSSISAGTCSSWGLCRPVVVVSPSETYGMKWGDSNFQILTELPIHHRRLESLEHFNVLYIYIILSTTVSHLLNIFLL